jgi:hypothetical protein
VTNLENAEIFCRSLVLQALHGPAAIAQASMEVQAGWQGLRQQFLEQRKLEM